ncbi:MAG: N-acetylmuramoyl-L-alanine amidase [Bacteroidota bacterium]
MKSIFFFFVLMISIRGFSQTSPVVNLIQPYKTNNPITSSKQFIIGNTCKQCNITINDKPVKVYSTGAFVHEIFISPGDTTFTITGSNGDRSVSKKINYSYTLPTPSEPVKTLDIASIQTFPEGDLILMPGDKIKFKVKALPNSVVKTAQGAILYEMPSKTMPGIYQGEYIVKETDNFSNTKIQITITDSAGNKISKASGTNFSMLSPLASTIAITKGRLAHLEYGLGDDRLGGAKVGYLDSNIVLNIVGKVGSHYKVQLSKTRTAYIPDDLVTLLPKGTFTPESLTAKWNVYGTNGYDYVKIPLFAKLPYQSFQLINPSKIVVDVFGATNNTNWITQLLTTKEIKNIDYQQIEDDIFRITIELNHQQHWGHQIYYDGNSLMIKVKWQPENLSLKNLTIAVDAGHGGSNNGAVGATGTYEKEITLALSLKLQKALQKEGAKVIMTRTKEEFFDNKERILFYRDSLPDLLLSIHLNSSEDPLKTGGTSTYYRYIGFKNLSLDIYKRMLELGLREYGNTGSFNFMLNSPIEYPNALVETLFLSNLDEEAKILDEKFQQQMVDKIVLGVKDFLEGCKEK